MDNRYKSIFNKMQYSTYRKIEKLGMPFCLSLFLGDAWLKTKDLCEIRNLYQEFIKNYNQLNKMFNFNNPAEIFALFVQLLNYGYLSKDHTCHSSITDVYDIQTLMGVNIMMGRGVCRHKSSMLADILNDYGIDSCILAVYMDDNNIKTGNINDTDEKKSTVSYTNYNYKANHAITFVSKDGMSYFLDVSKHQIYWQNKRDVLENLIYKDIFILHPPSEFSTAFSIGKDYTYYYYKTYDPHYPLYEQYIMIKNAASLFGKNLDVFNKFYDENRELYDEINEKILKLPDIGKRYKL